MGALGALAPEIVHWYRIAKTATPEEWRRPGYWMATACYLALGGALATLIAQPNGYAAFLTGVTAEIAIMGVLESSERPLSPQPGDGVEEIDTRPASPLDVVLVVLRRHAQYLRV